MSNDLYLIPFFLELLKQQGNVDQYKVNYFGSDELGHRPSSIWLYYGETRIATITFIDRGPPWDDEKEDEMHLPSAMFENVIDILRSERPIIFHFRDGHTFLATRAEPVGEAE